MCVNEYRLSRYQKTTIVGKFFEFRSFEIFMWDLKKMMDPLVLNLHKECEYFLPEIN